MEKNEMNNEVFSSESISLETLEERKEMIRILDFDVDSGEYIWFPDC